MLTGKGGRRVGNRWAKQPPYSTEMSLPKKGIRKITVDSIRYYWTVRIDYQSMQTHVGIGLVDEPNSHITLVTNLEEKDHTQDGSKFFSITPSLIKRAVKFAVDSDKIKWNGQMESMIELQNGVFIIS